MGIRGAVVASMILVASPGAFGSELVIPSVAAYVVGVNDSLWSVETRVTNLTDAPKAFAVVDWIGSQGWRPSSHTVKPGETLTLSGFDLYHPLDYFVKGRGTLFGAAVCDAEDGLEIQTAILSGVFAVHDGVSLESGCPVYAGGYETDSSNPCNNGAGPIIEGRPQFSLAGAAARIPWLHAGVGRRTNICLINPDLEVASVVLTVTGWEGISPISLAVSVGAHSLLQLNDVFSRPPFDAVKARALATGIAAARAVVQSDTRLLAVAYSISNENNTVSVSVGR